jgi:hypothetical protein
MYTGTCRRAYLCICEGNERGRCAVALVVGDDLDAVITEDTYARVGSSEIDTNSGTGSHGGGRDVRVFDVWGMGIKEERKS